MAPVFSLVLDRDVSEDLAMLYPELYKELTKVSVLLFRIGDIHLEKSVWLKRAGKKSEFQNILHLVDDFCISR